MIEIIKPAMFMQRYGVAPPDTSHGARLAALRFGVRNFAMAQTVWQSAGLTPLLAESRAIHSPDMAFGATLIFEPI
jgi:hypothetical protein